MLVEGCDEEIYLLLSKLRKKVGSKTSCKGRKKKSVSISYFERELRRFPREMRKEVNLMAKMRRFYEVIEELRLKDLLLSDCAFQCALPKIVSDHYPITLKGGGVKRGKILFRFENMWLLSNGFKELVRKWWIEYSVTRNSSHCLDETLRLLKRIS
ncbi:hypothetical protein CK203_043207 [Vitis vinifera]|uniref:Uncharacterized protein n=1 Tax=Vitis vinifera TaxID=29760 RepID=A0A438HP88_VITVI|nr:hypothetical protein CK203_043207 [Vitis vinifera]